MSTSLQINDLAVIILAAGKGRRMKSDLPKVMHLLKGRPLIDRVVRVVEKLSLGKPIVVINARHNLVEKHLENRVLYAVQKKQLGTGHAVAAAKKVLGKNIKSVLVLYGDMPFISSRSLVKLISNQYINKNILAMMTVKLPNFLGLNKQFFEFGRIIRDSRKKIIDIIERKDATAEQLKITEVNPGFYCFKAAWLWKNLMKLKNNNSQKEYYLTDMVKLAIAQNKAIGSIIVPPQEAVGINTKEQLKHAHKY